MPAPLVGLMLAAVAARRSLLEADVDWWRKVLDDIAHDEIKSVLLFLAVFLSRVMTDRWLRKADARKKKKKGASAHG